MNKQQNNQVEKLDVESLIVDLLACGLGACIILFFIFSINIIGKTAVSTTEFTTNKTKGKGSGFVALIGDDGDKKKWMGSVRIIEFSDLSAQNVEVLRNYVASGQHDFWNKLIYFKGHDKHDRELDSTIRTQVQVRKNNISFIIYARGMREIHFSFPDDLKMKLQNTRNQNALVKVFALEGRSVKGEIFNGEFETKARKVTDLSGFDLTFQIGKSSNIDRLIKMKGVS